MEKLRIREAQTLFEVLQDETVRLCLKAFFASQHDETVQQLLGHIRLSTRDTLKEAQIAGQLQVYENGLSELDYFARRMLKEATQ